MASHYSRPLHERFRPVGVRARADGWTVERQRGFVRALGEGLSTAAAASAQGMTERSANRLRRRTGAVSFAKAWDTAVALRRPAVDVRRPCRLKLHRWHGRVVHREWVWDEVAVRRVLANHGDPYGFERGHELSYRDGVERSPQRAHFRTFQQAHRARQRAADRATLGLLDEHEPVPRLKVGGDQGEGAPVGAARLVRPDGQRAADAQLQEALAA